MSAKKENFYDYDIEQLEELLFQWGEPGYRVDQVWKGIYQGLHIDPNPISNIPKSLRNKLSEYFSFSNLIPETDLISDDGQTSKSLFRLFDNMAIETVLMRYEKRRTLCISTQSGCALGCVFCATGQMGFRRNLTSGEIVEQVIIFARNLRQIDESLSNIVVMGMGEPFHNYKNTLAAIDRLNNPKGMNMGARRFTISTVGLVPQIIQFAKDQRQVNLAVSLHAADDDLRNSILPINRRYPLHDLMDACRKYVDLTHRRITFEWALILDVNDTLDQANKLARLLNGLLCHVNVIPLNPTKGYKGKATTIDRARRFQSELERNGIPCTIRVRRGIEIQAGCGQLASIA
jgi:23S rRNA (adenine2503-C2)-methyltransferase